MNYVFVPRPSSGLKTIDNVSSDSYDREILRSEISNLSLINRGEEAFSVYRKDGLVPETTQGDNGYVQFLSSSDRELNIPGHRFLVDLVTDSSLNFVTGGYDKANELIYLASLDSASRLNPSQLERYMMLIEDKLTTQLSTYNGALKRSSGVEDDQGKFIDRFRIAFREKVKQAQENPQSKASTQLLINAGRLDYKKFTDAPVIRRRRILQAGAGTLALASMLALPSLTGDDQTLPAGFLKPEYEFAIKNTALAELKNPNEKVLKREIQDLAKLLFRRAQEQGLVDKANELTHVEVVRSSKRSHYDNEGKFLNSNTVPIYKNKEGNCSIKILSINLQYFNQYKKLPDELNFKVFDS